MSALSDSLSELSGPQKYDRKAVDDTILKASNIWCFDIEWVPLLGYTYNTYKAYMNPKWVVQPGHMLSWSAASYEHPERVYSMDIRSGAEDMLSGLWKVLDHASYAVTYNGGDPGANGGYDFPKVKGELARLGLEMPRPPRSIDLFKTVRGMGWDYKSLYWAAKMMGTRTKVDNGGASLWWDCVVEDDPKAWKDLRSYNAGDVRATLDLYDALRPYIRNHPPVGFAAKDDEIRCPRCGSSEVRLAGTYQAQVIRYSQFRCENCRGLFRTTLHSRLQQVKALG